MSREFVAHILLDMYKEDTDKERGRLIQTVSPSQADMDEIKDWLRKAPKNHTRYIAPDVCFDAYTFEELWGDK